MRTAKGVKEAGHMSIRGDKSVYIPRGSIAAHLSSPSVTASTRMPSDLRELEAHVQAKEQAYFMNLRTTCQLSIFCCMTIGFLL